MTSAEHVVSLSRRQFLARCGVLGAVVVIPLPALGADRSLAAAARGTAVLRALAIDTISGLVAFVVPGPDAYSRAQGVTHPREGGVAAGGQDALLELFDRFVPFPDSFVQALAAGLATGTSDAPMPALEPVMRAAEETAAAADRALQDLLASDEAVPLSLVVALILNFVATSVNPGAVSGPFPGAPFANLAYAEKIEVFRRMEEDNAELVRALDGGVPEPMRGSLSGQVEFMAGALIAAGGLYSYSEAGVFDRERGVATRRPVGWDLSGYALGRSTPADGWREFRGYYRARRRARTTRRRARRRRRVRRA